MQSSAVQPILEGRVDVIISAATASGKTEAAWLPICSTLAAQADAGPTQPGVKVLYISPLKALINDQHGRLLDLCEAIDIPVNRRHGDVTGKERDSLRTAPDGALLITPESLEALFVLQGTHLPTIFAPLQYIVIDEMHSFIGTERGAQLQSLLHRIELAIRRPVRRIGLSATFADFSVAQDFLRPRNGDQVLVLDSPTETAELRMQLRGYLSTDDPDPNQVGQVSHPTDKREIADHLYRHLRGNDNLVFANSRASVEAYSDLLKRLSEHHRVSNEFLPHHGNLSKSFREEVEARLKARDTPTTAVCTSTLEMGIDIGSADSIAQIGAPYSVSAIRQRVGRSGRRDSPATLRTYISERPIDSNTHLIDRLRTSIMQSVAVLELMLEKWFEPPNTSGLHLSTLIQQVLSVIAQHGGASAAQLYSALCGDGPFVGVDKRMFLDLLRSLADRDVIMQAGDGLLLAGPVGERALNHYTFYAAFQTAEEYRLISAGQVLGSLPVDYPVLVGSMMIFTGRRWKVIDIDAPTKTIELTPSSGGLAPRFNGGAAEISDGVRRKMRELYEGDLVPTYVNQTAADLIEEGRTAYRQYNLADITAVESGTDSVIVAWRGSRIINTLSVMLTSQGITATIEGPGLTCRHTPLPDLLAAIAQLYEGGQPDPVELAEHVPAKEVDKHDRFLDPDLLAQSYAKHSLDVPGAWEVVEELVRLHPPLPLAYGGPDSERITPTHRASIGSTPFAVVDVETTSLSPIMGGRIVEIAIVHLDQAGNQTESWSTMVNPEGPVGGTSTHGLDEDAVADAPLFSELLDEIAHRLSDRIVVAQNASFDVGYLHSEFAFAGTDAPAWPTLCTLRLARKRDPGKPANLAALRDRFSIDSAHEHRAFDDAIAAAEVLRQLLQQDSTQAPNIVTDDEIQPDWLPPTWPRPIDPPRTLSR
ncbi:DEAD/DEAH box helicase [Aeromicrobium sp.]|uniref:DEAD/DEAH box helicase n=1 Tax=Aeromicrobium sp. TaxID=1871063 RepID=UPI002FC6279C